MITLSEYARRYKKDYGNIYRKYKKGDFETASKQGSCVMIDENEPLSDKRLVTGNWIGYRENCRKSKALRSENLEILRDSKKCENTKTDEGQKK